MHWHRHRFRLLALLAVALLAAACGTAKPAPATSGTGPAPASAPAPAAPAPAAPVQDTIKMAWSAGIDNLDPVKSANGPDMMIMSQVYETLLELDPDKGELKPRLATEWKALDNTTWQFKLRQGVKFQNGEPFNAQAVKFSIERVLDPKNASPHRSQIAAIDRVDVVDEYTVNVVTKAPAPVLPYRMQRVGGTGRVFILPPNYYKEKGEAYAAEHPVGTGPYKLAAWDRGKSMALVRNDEYWGGKPAIREATVYFIPESSTRVAALLSGEMDIIQRLPIDDIKRVAANKGTAVAENPAGLVQVFMVDPAVPPLQDIRVRQALTHAINMQGIIDAILQGRARELPVPVAPSVAQFNSQLKPLPYDPARARQLLQEAGYGNGFTLKTFQSDGRYVADKAIYDVVTEQLKQVGVTVEPQVIEWGQLISMMVKRQAGPFFIVGWDYSEGDASKMDSLFLSTGAAAMWKLTQYDALSHQANAEMDPAKRRQLWQDAQKLVHDQQAYLRAWQTADLFGVKSNLDWAPRFGDNLQIKDMKWKSQ